MSISVAIISWAPHDKLHRALRSLNGQTLPPDEVVVLDNRGNLDPDDLKGITEIPLRVVRAPFNMGCPPARSIAFANCRKEWIYSLDDDGWLAPDALEKAMAVARSSESVAIVQSQVVAPDGTDLIRFHHDVLFAYAAGACLMRREAVERAGGYPMHFFRQSEEQHLLLRLLDDGCVIRNCPDSVMFHEKSATTSARRMENSYGVAHSVRTVLELWPRWAVPFGVLGKLLSWTFYLCRRGEPGSLFGGLWLLLKERRYGIQPPFRRVRWETVRAMASGNRRKTSLENAVPAAKGGADG